MAENKKSFLLYCDLIHTVEKMPIEKAGELFLHILNYVNDKNPVTEDLVVNLTFEPIKQQLKRDLMKYEVIREQKVKAGLASADKRKHMSTGVEFVEQEATKPTVIVNDNDTEKESKTPSAFPFSCFWDLYPKKVSRRKCFQKWERLSDEVRKKIMDTLPGFLSYKPFPEYTHPNPEAYFNKQRWEDELPVLDPKKSISLPNGGEGLI